ncbi:MAG: sigma-54 dependent transcriptional regulator [Polyangiales bacterium]
MTKDRVLVIDDDADQCALLEAALGGLGYEVETAVTADASIDRAVKGEFDAIVTDLGMGGYSGVEMCERLVGARPGTPVIVVTGLSKMETAISAMRAGAYDYLVKPIDGKVLGISVARAIKHRKLESEVTRLREAVVESRTSSEIIGSSPSMRRVNDLIARVAPSDATVLIAGETGTGKELVARAIHSASERSEGPFVAINCAAVPASLLESELFGHAKGAFTDAKATRTGLFVRASGGTLFLDEIGEMPLDMQAKLLRALQEHVVRPVGSDQEISFDARIVAATHRDLEAEVAAGRFRQDLFFRIHVVRIDVPPLRERGNDVLKLATHFLGALSSGANREAVSLTTPVAQRLLAYDWPGNVRELENCLEHAIALAQFSEITVEDLPERVRVFRPESHPFLGESEEEIISLAELERRYIARVLRLVDGNKSRAAQLLGLDRRTLYRRLDREREENARAEAKASGNGASSHATAPNHIRHSESRP